MLSKLKTIGLFVFFFFTCCSTESVENESHSFKIEWKYLSPIFDYEVNKPITSKTYKLVYFEKDGGCVGCIATLKNWFDYLKQRDECTNNLDIYYILSKNDSVVTKHNLIILDLSHNIYWDCNEMVEKRIDSLKLKGLILLNNNDEIIFNVDPKTSDLEKEFINILEHTSKIES